MYTTPISVSCKQIENQRLLHLVYGSRRQRLVAVIILPHPDGRGEPDGAGDHDDGEDERDDGVGPGPAEHAGGHADDVPRRPVERQADAETLAPAGAALARPRQRGPGPERPDEGELRRERGHGHGGDRDRRPRGRVREQRAPREEAGEGGERERHAGCRPGRRLLEVYSGSWWMLWFG
jgi:hypothetical protein